jgi:hypothetical protein
MYKNQLQELAQRSCFNLPSYTCLREGPDHAPRFKAAVNFNGEQFESPGFFSTLRQAEHAAAEVALAALARRGPSYSLAARILVSRARGRLLPPILPPPRAPRFCASSFPWRGIFFSSISRGACFKRFSTVEFGDMRVLLVRV